MKRIYAILSLLLLLSVGATAQVRIGYFSYSDAMQSMPEYRMAQEEVSRIRAQYESEVKRSEEEFSAKYEDFLDNLTSYAASIRRKRQVELQQLMESNLKFREEAQRLIKQAEDEAMEPVKKRLSEVLAQTARQHGYVVVLNTDADTCPYIDPTMGEDITPLLKQALK